MTTLLLPQQEPERMAALLPGFRERSHFPGTTLALAALPKHMRVSVQSNNLSSFVSGWKWIYKEATKGGKEAPEKASGLGIRTTRFLGYGQLFTQQLPSPARNIFFCVYLHPNNTYSCLACQAKSFSL